MLTVLAVGAVVLVAVAFGYFLGATRNRNE